MKFVAIALGAVIAVLAVLEKQLEMSEMNDSVLLKYGFWRDVQDKEVDVCSGCDHPGCSSCDGSHGD